MQEYNTRALFTQGLPDLADHETRLRVLVSARFHIAVFL